MTEGKVSMIEAMVDVFGSAITGSEIQCGDQQVVHVEPSNNLEILTWLKDTEGYDYDLLLDVTAVDYGSIPGVEVVYQLWSITNKQLLRIKCALPEDSLKIRSVADLWGSANWLEREVYDLFGVQFEGHPDLRRILMPKNYSEGHPLRKDFPLRGRFSREKQTELALKQDYEDYYSPEQLEGFGQRSDD
ncbi:MAG TPA: NADH-quinone oxidoreductase subunit C [Gemmatimonadetes bacterium]|nr:NADH-quinone oxidoreductase subunit C [Gemmatimonadota bacterium]